MKQLRAHARLTQRHAKHVSVVHAHGRPSVVLVVVLLTLHNRAGPLCRTAVQSSYGIGIDAYGRSERLGYAMWSLDVIYTVRGRGGGGLGMGVRVGGLRGPNGHTLVSVGTAE